MAGTLLDLGSVFTTLEMRKDKWDKHIVTTKKDMSSLRGFAIRNEHAMAKMSKGFAVAGAAIAASIGFAAKKSIEFNKEIANIATLMPGATQEVLELRKNIQGLAVEYGKDSIDLAKGAYQVVSAFGAQAASSKKLEISTMAATAGMATTTDAINLLSAVSKGYNQTSDEQLEKISDLSFQVVKLGQTTFPELAASIGRVVPSAATLGVSMEEMSAVFATLTGVTGSAAEVSTQFAGLLRTMIKPTDSMKKAMKELGYETGEQMLSNLGLVESFRKLVATTDGSTISVGKLFRRAEAMTALFALTGTQADTFNMKLNEMSKASGSTRQALSAVTDGVNKAGFSFEQTKQRVTVLVQTIGELFLPVVNAMMSVMEPILKVFTFIANEFATMPGYVKLVIGGLTALTAVTLLATAAGMKILSMWSLMPAAITKTAAAFGPYVIGIAAAVAAGKVLANMLGKIGEAHDAVMAKIKQNAAQEKTIQDKLIAYRKQAKGRDLQLLLESNKIALGLENNSREEQLKWQLNFLKKRSENFRSFLNQKEKVVKEKTTSEIQAELEAQKRILEITTAARERAVTGTIQEFQFRKEQAAEAYRAEQEELKNLNASKAAFLTSARGYNMELAQIENDRINFIKEKERAAIEERQAQNQIYQEREMQRRMMYDEWIREQDAMAEFAVLEGRERERAALDMWHEEQRQKLIALLATKKINLKQFTAMRIALEQAFNNKVNNMEKDAFEKWKARMSEKYKQELTAGKLLLDAYKGYLDARQKRLDAWYSNEKKRIEESKMNSEQKESALEALEEKYTEKKRELVRKQAIIEKSSNIASAIMSTASAVAKAYGAVPPPANFALAALVGALGAFQIATIARTPLPMKEGGMTKGKEGMALLHKNEVVMPFEKIPQLFNTQNVTDSQTNFYISALDGADVERILHEKIIPGLERASMDEQIRFDQRAVVQNV